MDNWGYFTIYKVEFFRSPTYFHWWLTLGPHSISMAAPGAELTKIHGGPWRSMGDQLPIVAKFPARPPRNLTNWYQNLKLAIFKRNHLFQTIILGIQPVVFRGVKLYKNCKTSFPLKLNECGTKICRFDINGSDDFPFHFVVMVLPKC